MLPLLDFLPDLHLVADLPAAALDQALEHRPDRLGLTGGIGAQLVRRIPRGRRLLVAERDVRRDEVLIELVELLDHRVQSRTGEPANVLELVVDRRLHQRVGGAARNVALGLLQHHTGDAALAFGRHRERDLSLDGLHERFQWRVRPRQRPRDFDASRQVAGLDDCYIVDELSPVPAIVLQVQSLHLGGHFRAVDGARHRAAAGVQHPCLLFGQLESREVHALGEVLVIGLLGVERGHSLAEWLPALSLEDEQGTGAGLLNDGEVLDIRHGLTLQSIVNAVRQRVAAEARPDLGDEPIVFRDGRIDPAAFVQGIEVGTQRLLRVRAGPADQLSATRLVPVPDEVAVEMLGVVQHQVRFQVRRSHRGSLVKQRSARRLAPAAHKSAAGSRSRR